MKYLFIGAHQDDIEFSCGGTLLRLIDEGHDVFIAIMTRGRNALKGTEEERKQEQRNAFEFAKAKMLSMFDYEDGALPITAGTVGAICRLINEVEPDFVITHYPDDSHQDHRNLSAIVKSATRRKCGLAYFDSYSSINFKPNLFVDITAYVDKKKELLGLFKSQIEKYSERGIDFIEKSILIPKLNGYECKAPYAEGFALDTLKI